MTCGAFLKQAEELRRQNKFIAASVLYRVAADYAPDKEARQELIQESARMGQAGIEVAELERLYAR